MPSIGRNPQDSMPPNNTDTGASYVDGVVNSITSWGPGGSVAEDFNTGQSQYNFGRRVFPSDLGTNTEVGHYMVININVQNKSRMKTLNGVSMSTVLPNDMSTVDALRFNIDSKFFGTDPVTGKQLDDSYSQRGGSTISRGTTRIAESIAIYMPNSELTFTDVHDFDNVSLTAFGAMMAGGIFKFGASTLGAAVGAFLGGARGAARGGAGGAAIGDMVTGSAQTLGNIAQINGTPINPKIEVLYANTAQREFTFEFLMAPVSEEESRTVQEIIRILRYHAAPELMGGGAISSLFYIPPSEFDITFFNRGRENLAIPRINTCALTQVDVSYAPTGVWSTFHNGYPVQVRVMLRFRELEVVHKLRVAQGY